MYIRIFVKIRKLVVNMKTKLNLSKRQDNQIKEGKKRKYFHLREHKNRMSDILFRRILNLLASGEFDVIVTTRTGGEAGYIDYENSVIYLNPRLFPIEETMVHEALHILKPDLDEKSIIEMSSLMYENLNDNKRDKLITYIKALATKCVGIRKNELVASYETV